MKPTRLLQTWSTDLPPSLQLHKAVRARSLAVGLGLALSFVCLQAGAATVVVTAQNFSSTPSALAIAVGDSVSFTNAGGTHNVTGYNPAPPPEAFCGTALLGAGPMCLVTFTNTGVFRYLCVPHSSGSGTNFSGMIGSITVTSVLASASVAPAQSHPFAGGELTLSLNRTFNPPPAYQWQFNGADIPGATGPTLALSSLMTNHSGLYRVRLSNALEVVTTPAATVRVVDQLTLLTQPASTNVLPGSSVALNVSAISALPFHYQWHKNGTPIADATNDTLTFTNVQVANDGLYTVVVSDALHSVTSQGARLGVLISATITQGPISQSVVAGGSATFSVEIEGNPGPFEYEWRRTTNPRFTNRFVLDERRSFFTLPSVTTNQSGNYVVVVRNAATPAGVNRSFTLTLLADTDGDGLPDDWELAHGLSATDAADAALDSDGDGHSNLAEYRAGTSPTNAASCLRIEGLTRTAGQARMSFNAASNQTYTVDWCSNLNGGSWTRLADVTARTNSRVERVSDPDAGGAARFYRVVTPRRP